MEYSQGPEQDIYQEVPYHKPVTELLHDATEVARLWPAYDLTQQIEQHVAETAIVTSTLDCLPATMSSQEALNAGYVAEEQLAAFYRTLGTIIDNPDYRRLVLYVPFEILPHKAWEPENIPLRDAVDHFRTSYIYGWNALLDIHDVQANFVTGDVLEEEFRTEDIPRVVKAAHFIPELVQRGLIDETYLKILLDIPDPILQQSVNQALNELYGLESSFPAHGPEKVSTNRQAWLDQLNQEKVIDTIATQVAQTLLHGTESHNDVLTSLTSAGADSTIQGFVEGNYQAIMQADPKTAQKILDQQQPLLEFIWRSGDEGGQDRVASIFRRLHRAGKIPIEELARLGVSLPTLAGPFSENLAEIPSDIAFLKRAAEAIQDHPLLGEVLYPVVTVGGSSLKGYGSAHSDVDVSVFVKPGVSLDMKQPIRKAMDALFTRDGIQYEPIECWLQETANGQLEICDPEGYDIHAADSLWTHILFGNAWLGNESHIQELQQRLLPAYFHTTDETQDGINKRNLYLERLEQDILQYRLMHKGYARHYPLLATDKTIDKSTFWDPGYRQLATKLFVSTVFLPKIS